MSKYCDNYRSKVKIAALDATGVAQPEQGFHLNLCITAQNGKSDKDFPHRSSFWLSSPPPPPPPPPPHLNNQPPLISTKYHLPSH
jgi:hypothetical protein